MHEVAIAVLFTSSEPIKFLASLRDQTYSISKSADVKLVSVTSKDDSKKLPNWDL